MIQTVREPGNNGLPSDTCMQRFTTALFKQEKPSFPRLFFSMINRKTADSSIVSTYAAQER